MLLCAVIGRAAMRNGSGCPLLSFRKRANERLTSHRGIDACDGVARGRARCAAPRKSCNMRAAMRILTVAYRYPGLAEKALAV